MSNGGVESGKEKDQESNRKQGGRGGGGDDYGRMIARIAVAQICENLGFQTFQQSALDTLSVVAIRYLRELGKNAHLYANLAGRTESNVLDIVHGLEDLSLAQGFTAASDINRRVASSGTVKEIIQYVNLEDEIPFARPVPHFPVVRSRKTTPTFVASGQNPDGEHIPDWLPTFPDPETYAQTLTCNERATDTRMYALENAEHQRNADRSVLSLQQMLESNGSRRTLVEPGDIGKAKEAAQSNPFLAPPLPFGEKEITPVVPAKLCKPPAVNNQGMVMETLAPATAGNGICNSKDDERKVLPNKRPSVHFRLVAAKKFLGGPQALTLKNDAGKTAPWFGRDDD